MPGAPTAFRAPDVPELSILRTCVHCGLCLPQCPTYRLLREEMDSPRGRLYLMRAVAEGRLGLTETLTRHLDLCLGCRACETACPSGVPYGSLLEATRAQLQRHGPPRRRRLLDAFIFSVFPEPGRLGVLLRGLRLLDRTGLLGLGRATGLVRFAPRLAAMDALLPSVPAADSLPEVVPARGHARGRVGLLTGCVQRHLYPHVNRDSARLLAAAGWEVVIPRGQGCCGALELHTGRLDDFRARAARLVAAFPEDLDFIVTNAAGCGSTMKAYDHWLSALPDAASFAARVRDVSQVLVDAELPLRPLDLTVTYHDACHLAHGQRVRAEPRALLRRIPGLSLVELADSDLCCGSAGVYNLEEPVLADRLLELKVASIAATGARVVAAANPGCLLQIQKGCRARGLDVEVVHPVELLARALESGSNDEDPHS